MLPTWFPGLAAEKTWCPTPAPPDCRTAEACVQGLTCKWGRKIVVKQLTQLHISFSFLFLMRSIRMLHQDSRLLKVKNKNKLHSLGHAEDWWAPNMSWRSWSPAVCPCVTSCDLIVSRDATASNEVRMSRDLTLMALRCHSMSQSFVTVFRNSVLVEFGWQNTLC